MISPGHVLGVLPLTVVDCSFNLQFAHFFEMKPCVILKLFAEG